MSAGASLLGGGVALAASASWAVSTVLVKGAIVRLGARAFNFFRCIVALALFWITSVAFQGGHALHAMATRDGQTMLLSGVIGLALGDVLLFSAVRRLGAQPAVAMNQLSPVWSALLGFLLGSERLGLADVGGIALVIAGVLLVIFGRVRRDVVAADARDRTIGLAVGLLSSLCNATAGMLTRHAIAGVGELSGSTLRMSGGAAALIVASVVTRRLPVDAAPLRALPRMQKELIAVFLATFLGIFCQQAAYARLDASVALCLLSTTPIFLLPLAVGILHERYRPMAWFGTLLATAGIPLLVFQGDATPMTAAARLAPPDPHSNARPAEAAVKHLDLDLVVDFAKQELRGRASLEIEARADAKELVLDTRELRIERVTTSAACPKAGERAGGSEAKFVVAAASPQPVELGSALTIPIAAALARGERWVNVTYATSPGAAALQWLAPEQTAGGPAGKSPFLFTQSQAILARTWIPCQDTPSVRMTYSARITVPVQGGAPLLALMSAENPQQRSANGVYDFRMPQAIPSYLMALAVGDIDFRPLGPRSGVYAEPSVVEKAAYEMADLEQLIAAAESLYGPYRWGRYDVIVLPPSFPFGGMENPRLTFATPTILAGDRSLVALVAHELAHSWSGNLVTNATWNDFWLNEGFTVYFEHRIMEVVFGDEFEDALAVLGLQDLERSVAELRAAGQEADTCLALKLEGRNPDDGVTEVPYEKGARFLQVIEAAVGRARFDLFLRKWFDTNAFQSRTTADFVAFLKAEFARERPRLLEEVQADAWLFGPGIPANAPRVTSTALAQAEAQLARFVGGTPAKQLDVKSFTTQQWQCFLRKLPDGVTAAQLAELDRAFDLSARGNSEILFAWLMQCVQHRYEPAFPAVERFLTAQGRRKFLKPLYQELAKSDWGRDLARRIYEKARPTYHAVSRDTIDDLLQWGK